MKKKHDKVMYDIDLLFILSNNIDDKQFNVKHQSLSTIVVSGWLVFYCLM